MEMNPKFGRTIGYIANVSVVLGEWFRFEVLILSDSYVFKPNNEQDHQGPSYQKAGPQAHVEIGTSPK